MTDEDVKGKYRTAVAIWIIVLIIIGMATVCMVYMWWKGKKVNEEIAKEMIT